MFVITFLVPTESSTTSMRRGVMVLSSTSGSDDTKRERERVGDKRNIK